MAVIAEDEEESEESVGMPDYVEGLTSLLRKKKTKSEAELCQSQDNQSWAVFNMHEIIY